jgi:hypothetical protein
MARRTLTERAAVSALFLLLFVSTLAISLLAVWRVKRTYLRDSKVPASCGLSGDEVATRILERAGITDTENAEHDEMLGNHYDPTHRRLDLSTQNFHGTSWAALGVSAHECGHAIQHQIGYASLKRRMAAVGATSCASQVVMWLPFTGLLSAYTGTDVLTQDERAASGGYFCVKGAGEQPMAEDAGGAALLAARLGATITLSGRAGAGVDRLRRAVARQRSHRPGTHEYPWMRRLLEGGGRERLSRLAPSPLTSVRFADARGKTRGQHHGKPVRAWTSATTPAR